MCFFPMTQGAHDYSAKSRDIDPADIPRLPGDVGGFFNRKRTKKNRMDFVLIGSRGLAYLPTFGCFFYGKCR